MRDEQDKQLDNLFMVVRSVKPDTRAVEDHFETRLLARLDEQGSGQTLWSSWAWRLIPWFATIVIIVGIGNVVFDPMRSNDLFSTFSNYEEYLTTNMLAGE